MAVMYLEGRDSAIKKDALPLPAAVRAASFTSETKGVVASGYSIAEDSKMARLNL